MKKLLIASLMVLGVAGFAFAQQNGQGMGMGKQEGQGGAMNCPCPMGMGGGAGPHGGYRGGGHDMMQGKGCYMQQQDMQVAVKTADEAKAKVQTVISSDFKGYKITKTEEFVGRGGNKSFRVLANDAGGNEFIFHVNPFGKVKGPMLAKNMPAKAPQVK